MKHLFIINPTAALVRDRVSLVVNEIEAFFHGYGQALYDIHITRWARDAMGYVQRYVLASKEPVRIHAYGGSGTLYEVVNGTIGLPNVQIAAYPMGRNNAFLHQFGVDKRHLFKSIRNQVFSGAMPVDAIRSSCGYSINYVVMGLVALIDREGLKVAEQTRLPMGFCYRWAAGTSILSNRSISQNYHINLDGDILDGEFSSLLISRELDVFLIKKMSKGMLLKMAGQYIAGNTPKQSEFILRKQVEKIIISSDQEICISMDGEKFYEKYIEYEMIPYAIDFVCPEGIDIEKLPHIDNKLEGWRYNCRVRKK